MRLSALILLLAMALTASHAADNASTAETEAITLGPFGIGSSHVNGRSAHDAERWVPQMPSSPTAASTASATSNASPSNASSRSASPAVERTSSS